MKKYLDMNIEATIINYLIEAYSPQSIILYGSFADGSANENSDFDALVIADHAKCHDTSVIENTVLDVFVYSPDTFSTEYDPDDYIQIFDGKIVLDLFGAAGRLKQRVCDYLESIPQKSHEEIRQEIDWCEKMLSRTVREDAEGFFRWHWVLCDSLEIYCDIKHKHYFGPKKSLRFMEQTDYEAFQIYSQALKELNREYLAKWISYLKTISLM